MARRKYRPYRTRKQQQQRRIRTIALTLLVLAVGIVIVVKTSKKETQPENGNEVVSIDDIFPEDARGTDTAVETESDAEPDPVIPETIVAKTPEPASPVPEPVVEAVQQLPVAETPPADNGATSPEAQELIEKAMQLSEAGRIIPTRDLLNHALDLQLSATVRAAVKNKLANLAEKWLFSRDVYESDKLTSYYLVQSGDLLAVIAKRYKVPYQALMEVNKIARPELLQAGRKIKVIDGPFNAVIYKSSFTMDLYLQNVYVKTYRVGLGKEQYDTPSGRWRVKKGGKLDNKPTWTDPDTGKTYKGSDPDYPLGSRWIALEGLDGAAKGRTGFAIHGTKDPKSIGTRSSRGCIRLYNGEVVEAYNLLQEGLSEILIVE